MMTYADVHIGLRKDLAMASSEQEQDLREQQIIEPNPLLVSRMVGEQALLLDPHEDEIQLLNDVGSLIWRCILRKTYSREQILTELVNCFDVDQAQAEQDLSEFLDLLALKNMIKTVKISTNKTVSPLAETGTRKSP